MSTSYTPASLGGIELGEKSSRRLTRDPFLLLTKTPVFSGHASVKPVQGSHQTHDQIYARKTAAAAARPAMAMETELADAAPVKGVIVGEIGALPAPVPLEISQQDSEGIVTPVVFETHLDADGALGPAGTSVLVGAAGVLVVGGARATVEYETVGTHVLMVMTLMLPPAAGAPAPEPGAPAPGEPAPEVELVLGTGTPEGDTTVGRLVEPAEPGQLTTSGPQEVMVISTVSVRVL